MPPMRASRFKKIIMGLLKSRQDPPVEIDDGDIYFIHDGFKHGHT